MKEHHLHQTILLVTCLFGFLLLFGCSTEDHQIQGTFQGEGEVELWLPDLSTCEPESYVRTIPGEISVTGQQIGKFVTGTLYIPSVSPTMPLPIFGTNEVIGSAAHLDFTLGVPLGNDSYFDCSGTIIATDLTEDKIADSLQLDPDTRNACVSYHLDRCTQIYIVKSGELLSYSYQ